MRSAAQSLYPHLRSANPAEPTQRRAANLADAMWPSLSREQKAKDADQRLWEECCKRARDNFLRAWRAERRR
jgi:hypothetical protein